jgi:3',5'-cyclic-AMP phosphodiesterase
MAIKEVTEEQRKVRLDRRGKAPSTLKKFGSLTVLNGHIYQIMQRVEGNVAFHTARSRAFPQPAPGTAPSPGPMKVPEDQLRKYLVASRA